MTIRVEAVPCLNKKREFVIYLNNKALLICGKREVASVVTVIENGKIDEDLTTINKSRQGRILKLVEKVGV